MSLSNSHNFKSTWCCSQSQLQVQTTRQHSWSTTGSTVSAHSYQL